MTIRTMSTAVASAVTASTGELCFLLSLPFSGGTVYLTTASRNVAWNSQTWVAVGGLLSFEAARETTDLSGQSVKVTLDGVSQIAIAAFLGEHYIGGVAELYLAHFAADGTVIATPLKIFAGYMNSKWTVKENIGEGENHATVSTVLVSPIARFHQIRGIRANQNSHKAHFSSDTFMRHIMALEDGDIGWGIYQPGALEGVNPMHPSWPPWRGWP
jgi:hypothetical protein